VSLFGRDRDRDGDRGRRSAQERERARLEREARRRGVPLESLAPDPDAVAGEAGPEPAALDGDHAVEEGAPVAEDPGPDEPPAPALPQPEADAPADERVRAAAVPVEQSTVEWTALERSLVEDPGPPSSNGTGSHERVRPPEDEAGEPFVADDEPRAAGDASSAFFDEPALSDEPTVADARAAADEPAVTGDERPAPGDEPPAGADERVAAPGEPAAALDPRVARLRADRSAPGSRFRRRSRTDGGTGAGGPRLPPRTPKKPAERGPRPPGGARKWITRVVVPLLIVGVLAIGWFVISLYQPFIGSGGDPVRVTVPAGLTTRQIGDLLADKGVVDSGFFFALKARIDGNKGSLEAGSYTFRKGMSYEDAQAILLKGPPPIRTVSLRLPEGNTERDFAAAVDKSGKVRGKYLRAVRRARFNPRRYGAPAGSPLEGFLFPATYELNKKDASARALVAEQLATFKRNFRRVSMRAARRANLTRYEVLIIASMVEREAQLPRERPIIAGVIYNRLRQSIPLGIDATIRYATNNWTRPIRQSQLEAPGPYNTRLNQGLPPTPIGNPGLASIRAAANPRRTGYLFFVVKPGGNGAHAFSRTDAQFQRDVARYNNARTAAGGRDPK
jgi:UPF0755 protein